MIEVSLGISLKGRQPEIFDCGTGVVGFRVPNVLKIRGCLSGAKFALTFAEDRPPLDH